MKRLSLCPAGGIVDGAIITVNDFVQDVEINILVVHATSRPQVGEERAGGDATEEEEEFQICTQAEYEVRLSQLEQEASSENRKRKRELDDQNGDSVEDLI